MTPRRALGELFASADFARVYTLTVFAVMLGAHLVERLAGQVTLASMVAGLVAIGIGMLVSRRREVSLVRLVPLTLLLLCGWAGISVFWAMSTRESLFGWLSMVAVAVLAVVIGHVRDTLQTVRAFGDVARASLLASLALEIFAGILVDRPLPFLGVTGELTSLGPIQGVFGTRNALGIVAVLAVVTFAVELQTRAVRTSTAVSSIVLASALALLSASPTVLVLTVAVALSALALAVVRAVPARHRNATQSALGVAVVTAAFAAFIQRTRLIEALGATDDLQMRTELWGLAGFYTRFRPVNGWGWYGPWPEDEAPFATINLVLDQTHTTALNAYVDMLLQLGWAGLLLFIVFGGLALARSWIEASQRRSVVYAWTPLILITIGVTSLFESSALFGFGWLLLVVAVVRAGQSRSWRNLLRRSRESSGLEAGPG